jgi:hypothetical protein
MSSSLLSSPLTVSTPDWSRRRLALSSSSEEEFASSLSSPLLDSFSEALMEQRQLPDDKEEEDSQLVKGRPLWSSSSRWLQSNELMDLVDLQDFDVQLARVDSATPIQVYELTDLVTEWLNDSFEQQLKDLQYDSEKYADFNSVMLLERKDGQGGGRQRRSRFLVRDDAPAVALRISYSPGEEPIRASVGDVQLRRRLESPSASQGQLFTAAFKGAALFSRSASQERVPADVVRFMQETALANKTALLEAVQKSGAAGLGDSVVDLNAFTVASGSSSGGSDSSLEAIIIVAVAVAAVAFLFLLIAIFWAWRHDRRNRQAYLASSGGAGSGRGGKEGGSRRGGGGAGGDGRGSGEGNSTTRRSTDPSQSSTIDEHLRRTKPPSPPIEEIVGESRLYPESVISEDISTSLSQYYRSGMSYANSAAEMRGPAFGRSSSAGNGGGGANARNMDHLNDAASVSSMESYGYSLDGYAPSTATPMPRDYSSNAVGVSASGSGPLTRAGARRTGGEVDVDDDDEPEGVPESAGDPRLEEDKF